MQLNQHRLSIVRPPENIICSILNLTKQKMVLCRPTILHTSPHPNPPLKFNCTLNGCASQIPQPNLFEICRVEMKRKIELREHGRWALFRPNWILCNAKLNQNTIFIVSTDRAKIDASLIFSFYRCKYRILFSLSASDIHPYLYYSISILNG